MTEDQKFLVEKVLIEMTMEDGTKIKKRAMTHGKKIITLEDWEDIE